jgi:hypothetical protein
MKQNIKDEISYSLELLRQPPVVHILFALAILILLAAVFA